MRINKQVLKRPRCEGCGGKIYRSNSPFRNYFWEKIPSNCSNCGKQLSNEKKKQLQDHDEFLWLSLCLISITIFIVIIVVFSILS
ncbi:MAG: hypothetical protein ACFFCV_13185 [Promethearchaeota archaeon]